MFKRVNNWHLSLMVVVVSIFSILLIQQYVTAQSAWTNPGSLPGVTPSNTFLLNPLAEDLDIGYNDVSVVGDNVTLDGSSAANALTIQGGRKICLGGTAAGQCKDAWPIVSGGIIGEGTESKVAVFAGTNLSNTTTTIKSSSVMSENTGLVSITSGALKINNTGGSYNPLHIRFTSGATTNGIYIENNNAAGRAMLIDNISSTNNREALLIHNRGTNHSLYINDSVNSGDYSDTTPFVIDASGQVGISTSTPMHDLDIYGVTQSAEIGLYTQSTGYTGTHWGIYHHNDFANGKNELTFWNGGFNQAKISSNGDLWLRNGQICDINGQNCWSGAGSATSYWSEDSNKNLSRPEANIFLLASTSLALPSSATGLGNRMLWYPDKKSFRAGAVSGTQWNDTNIGDYSTAFGYDSIAAGDYSFAAGRFNSASGTQSFIGSGTLNEIFRNNGLAAFIGGGYNNKIGQGGNTVQAAIVAGGDNRILEGNAAFIGGGVDNTIDAGTTSAITAGSNNIILNADAGFIGGGDDNTINGAWWSFIGGGASNIASGNYASIGGGATSTASGIYSTVSGGTLNTASGPYSAIGGGQSNTTSGYDSTVAGGRANRAAGDYSTVAGGKDNYADGDYSFAGGRWMQLSSAADRSFVWGYAGGPTSITRDNTFSIFPVSPGIGSAPRVGIGTASPNAALEVRSLAENAEIDIRTGSGNHWGIYQNGDSGNLNFWYVDDVVTLSGKGIGVNSDSTDGTNYYMQLDVDNSTSISATDCDAASEYGRVIFGQDSSGQPRLWVCHSTGWSYINLN